MAEFGDTVSLPAKEEDLKAKILQLQQEVGDIKVELYKNLYKQHVEFFPVVCMLCCLCSDFIGIHFS